MSLEFLLEIGCEEIPARFVENALGQLKQKLSDLLFEHTVEHGSVAGFATPRRLIVTIDNLAEYQPDRTEVVTGPPYSVAFDSNRQPTGAARGFANKNQVPLEQLHCIQTEKGQYLGFEKKISGESSETILGQALPSILGSIEFPKQMRWEESRFAFVRPIRWILCLLGRKVVRFSVAGIQSSNQTFGHRILSGNQSISVHSVEEYRRLLLKAKVIIDPSERLETISRSLQQEAEDLRSRLIPDSKLLGHVTYLNEFPSVVCGSFDPKFLRIPREVLVTVMREHQKYFSLIDSEGQLLPKFLAVTDSDGLHADKIRAGHERVLKARLADASFFWDVDRKLSLEDRVEKLSHILFQQKLGTVLEKTNRLVALVEFIARSVKRSELSQDLKQAAKLCKTDLTTEMVKEFTDLQGIMGGLYARVEGRPESIATAIYEHYRPGTLEDASPATEAGAVLSIADKLDSVVGAFAIELVPTGSKDPLALRRQTMGLLKVLVDKKISISLKKIFKKSFSLFKKKASRSLEDTLRDFDEFVRDRLRYIAKEQGFRYDEVNAIVDVSFDNPLDFMNRLKAISAMRGSHDFASVAQSFKRIKNILVKAGLSVEGDVQVNAELFDSSEERALDQAIRRIKPRIERARRKGDYQRVFESMAELRLTIDHFFDKVLVMAEDPAARHNRLSLLRGLVQMFLELADVSEIVVSS